MTTPPDPDATAAERRLDALLDVLRDPAALPTDPAPLQRRVDEHARWEPGVRQAADAVLAIASAIGTGAQLLSRSGGAGRGEGTR